MSDVSTADDAAGATKEWRPAYFLSDDATSAPFALIVLNQPIENEPLFLQLCRKADCIVCADGGANRLKDLNLSGDAAKYSRPEAICGDMDSLRPDVEAYYEAQGTKVVKDPYQYSTDITKALQYCQTRYGSPEISGGQVKKFNVALLGGLGGRGDQAFSLLNHISTPDAMPNMGDIFLITPESIIFQLRNGKNRITTPVDQDRLGENVGIIPLGRPSIISTKGLEWDVQDWHTEFGGQVSTSNHIRSDVIDVDTTERVLFTVELARKVVR